MSKRRKRSLAVIAWMAVIFCFTQLPYFTGKNTEEAIQKAVVTEHNSIKTPSADHVNLNDLNLIVRKTTHVMVFGVLALLLFKSFETYRFTYILSWVLTTFYAMTDEYHQSFMPGRVAAISDVFIDSFGAVLTLSLTSLVIKKRRKRNIN